MSAEFKAVHWSPAKRRYDLIMVVAAAMFLWVFIGIEVVLHPPADALAWIDVRIRAFGVLAFLMLTAALAIGPACRLDPRLLPLLANRRHLGVATALAASLHALFMLEWYWAQGTLASLVSELTTTADYVKFIGFPFKVLGIAALAILLLMAATSHDYWLAFLGPRAWKALHMAGYAAYALAVMHVALGALQWSRAPWLPGLLLTSAALLASLHLTAARREQRRDETPHDAREGWISAGPWEAIPDRRAVIIVPPSGERIAVYRNGREVAALAGVCAHQMGPIGEGCIADGLVTCPWHGWQYRLADGCAPPPFTERLATYPVRIRDGLVEVSPRPNPPGTRASVMVE